MSGNGRQLTALLLLQAYASLEIHPAFTSNNITPRVTQIRNASGAPFVPLPRLVFPTLGSFFRRDKAAIGKAFVSAQLLLVVKLGQEGAPEREQHAALFPTLEPVPARTGTAIPPGEFASLDTGPEDPEDTIEKMSVLDT